MQQNNENLHPVLADYAKDIFIGLGFFNENIILWNDRVFFFLFVCSFCFISLYEVTCLLLCKFLVVRWC